MDWVGYAKSTFGANNFFSSKLNKIRVQLIMTSQQTIATCATWWPAPVWPTSMDTGWQYGLDPFLIIFLNPFVCFFVPTFNYPVLTLLFQRGLQYLLVHAVRQDPSIWELQQILKSIPWKCTYFNKTSQELRMLSNATLNCQVAKIVMNSSSQLSEL